MKVVRFPGRDGAVDGEAIDAALNGELAGPEALAVRELRDDIRALAAPPDAGFERELQARVAEWARERREPRRARLRRRLAASPGRSLALGGAVAALVAFALVVVLASGHDEQLAEKVFPTQNRIAPHRAEQLGAAQAVESSAAAPAAASRLQQLGASVTLATGSEAVQEAADAVSRLGTSYGGYVQSSHVQVRKGGTSEAQLVLSLPSAKLSQAIAALGRIAPERAVNQESQDITSSYDAARRQLGDDEAVRRALLRALAAATTQGQIESLRARLAGNRAAISRDREAVHAVARRAATSRVEVTIEGGRAHDGLTLGAGARDAGDVLQVAGAVALIALAVLVPLALIALAVTAAARGWRRRRRESALGA